MIITIFVVIKPRELWSLNIHEKNRKRISSSSRQNRQDVSASRSDCVSRPSFSMELRNASWVCPTLEFAEGFTEIIRHVDEHRWIQASFHYARVSGGNSLETLMNSGSDEPTVCHYMRMDDPISFRNQRPDVISSLMRDETMIYRSFERMLEEFYRIPETPTRRKLDCALNALILLFFVFFCFSKIF